MATLRKDNARRPAAEGPALCAAVSYGGTPGRFGQFSIACGPYRLALSREEAETLARTLARQLGTVPGSPTGERYDAPDVAAWAFASDACELMNAAIQDAGAAISAGAAAHNARLRARSEIETALRSLERVAATLQPKGL